MANESRKGREVKKDLKRCMDPHTFLKLKRIAFRVWILIGIGLLVGMMFDETLGLRFVQVNGSSMNPSFKHGEIVLMHRAEEIEPGDVVVIQMPSESMAEEEPKDTYFVIKRVVGVPGDYLEFYDLAIFRNGERQPEYDTGELHEYSWVENKSVDLEKDEYYVLGDNRNHSDDSRLESFGLVKREQILGKVFKKMGMPKPVIQETPKDLV